ncbi:hypothetical protein AB0M36_23805 [Actinoplanes sp. NPDC051346]|uniref:hypothetical protein n=1 Tax=Actinoplanes sp. NPDC051346 TaxID=3155048 RepID=UPI003445EB97
MRPRARWLPASLAASAFAVMFTVGCANSAQPTNEPAATHQHAGTGPADTLVLAGNGVLVVVVLGLVFRRPRVRARADGRWRLPRADRQPGPAGDGQPQESDQDALPR